ncbi:MAG: CoA transferase [Dehalococcoidia bacterium]|jgi:crotonobetainyl-CoA:carnitine CoA-transferase CaiB-like acyl-CoA transferase|nr:CoA transferase [Dehalococcoidia bacterium]
MAELLEGIRVLDLSDWVAGSYAGRLLADYGADVIKVERPGGSATRREGPYAGDDPNIEKSALFLHLNANKRSITLDFMTERGAEIARDLAAKSDIVIEDYAPGVLAEHGLDYTTLSAGRDDLVMASITPFGQTGPWRDYRGSEITLQAMGGPMHSNGTQEREPIKSGGYVAHYHAGISAALGSMLARYRVESSGAGDHIDLAVYETQAGFRDRRTPSTMAAAYTGFSSKRQGGGQAIARGVRIASDGYVNLLGHSPRYWPAFLKLIGRDDLNDREESKLPAPQMPQEFIDEVEASYQIYLIERTKQQVVIETQAIGVLGGAIYTTEDLLTDPQYRGRGVWDEIDHPVAGKAEYAGRQLILSESPREPVHHAPLLGEGNEAIYENDLGLSHTEVEQLQTEGVI